MKNLRLKWTSVAVAALFCAVLLAFAAASTAAPQVIRRADSSRIVTLADLYEHTTDLLEKAEALESRVSILDERLARMEQKLDDMGRNLEKVLQSLKKLNRGLE